MNRAAPQDAHTILFGTLHGDLFTQKGVRYPQGFRDLAFAAYFGPIPSSRKLTFTLYRINGVRHSVIWSVTQPVSKDATGFADTLAGVGAAGVYGLGVSSGIFLLAWGSFEMVAPCIENCGIGG